MLTIRDSQMQDMAESSPNTPMIQPCDKTKSWIEVHLVDEDGNPVAGAHYKIQLPDSSIMDGSLDDQGKVRFDGIVPGTAIISFPDIDGREWKPQ